MELEPTPTAFAVLDILGYGRLMAKKPEEVLILMQELLKSSVINRFVQHDLDQFARLSGADTTPVIEYLQFSDTLIIYLREDKLGPAQLAKPSQLVESVCYATSLTLAHFIATGIPLRGAIGFGRTFISQNSQNPFFFTGVELYETFKLEREQMWAGAALHHSAEEALEDLHECPFVARCSVPMVDSSGFKPEMAIDWVSCLKCGTDIIPPWNTMFRGSDPKIETKREKTLSFYKLLDLKPRSVSLGVAKETIDSMRTRLSHLLT